MATLRIRVHPGARRVSVEPMDDGRVRVRVSAPPVDGKANQAVITALADSLGVPKSAVTIQRGSRGRDKTVEVDGYTEEELRRRLQS